MKKQTSILAVMVLLLAQQAACARENYAAATEGRPVINQSYFGMHFHRLEVAPGERMTLTQWPDQLVGSIRLWDSGTRWADIAPSGGQWRFDRMDSYVQNAIGQGASIVYTLGSTPRWAASRPDESCPYGPNSGCASEPVRMAHWEEYVRRVVERYKGRIFAYELWNEPFFSDMRPKKSDSDFFYGPVSQMVEMAKIARKVLDELDPKAILTTPGFTGPVGQMEMLLNSGGKQYVQSISYHFYADHIDQFTQQILAVRSIMKRQHVEQMPLWNTETGLEVHLADKPLPRGAKAWTRSDTASLMSQFLVFGAAAGLKHYYYYAWDNERSGMVGPQSVRQPARDSYETTRRWLVGATMQGCDALLPSGVVCYGDLAGKRFAIAWATKDAMHTISAPANQWITSVENLMTTATQAVIMKERTMKLMLGSEPVRILFGAQ